MSKLLTNVQLGVTNGTYGTIQETTISNGNIYFSPTGELFYDWENERIQITDVVICEDDDEFNALEELIPWKFYFIKDGSKLYLISSQGGYYYINNPGSSDVYIVQAGTTTFSEILEAYNSNKVILCYYNNRIYQLASYANDNTFSFVNVNGSQMLSANCYNRSTNFWTFSTVSLELTSNKIQAVTGTSSSQYPSDAAVYNFVDTWISGYLTEDDWSQVFLETTDVTAFNFVLYTENFETEDVTPDTMARDYGFQDWAAMWSSINQDLDSAALYGVQKWVDTGEGLLYNNVKYHVMTCYVGENSYGSYSVQEGILGLVDDSYTSSFLQTKIMDDASDEWWCPFVAYVNDDLEIYNTTPTHYLINLEITNS